MWEGSQVEVSSGCREIAGKEMRAVMTAKGVGHEVGTERFVYIWV